MFENSGMLGTHRSHRAGVQPLCQPCHGEKSGHKRRWRICDCRNKLFGRTSQRTSDFTTTSSKPHGKCKACKPHVRDPSTTYPAEGPKESWVVGGKPLDPQNPEDNILPGSPADPLPDIGSIFNEGADGGGKVSSGGQATGALDNVATTIHPG